MLKFIFKIYHYIQVFLLRLFAKCFSRNLNISKFGKTLIISPHPDDEVFGCGGLMHSLRSIEREVFVIIMSKGEDVHRHCCPNEEENVVLCRTQLTSSANKILGVESNHIYRMEFPDGYFASVKADSDLITNLGNVINEIAPTEVFIPHPYENSPDHESATRIIEKVLGNSSVNIYYYCVWAWYHMPMYKILMLNYKKAHLSRIVNSELKNQAIDIYINNSAKCGVSYSGDLPKPLIFATRWKYELFFKA